MEGKDEKEKNYLKIYSMINFIAIFIHYIYCYYYIMSTWEPMYDYICSRYNMNISVDLKKEDESEL